MNEAIDRIVEFFETLTPQALAHLPYLYTSDAYFKDPFNEVRGLSEIERIFSHMYVALDRPHFVITSRIVDGHQCFLAWDFHFWFRSHNKTQMQTVRGGSHLVLNAQGLVQSHRDYWDAAEELYEKLPLLGSLMRWLKRRANS